MFDDLNSSPQREPEKKRDLPHSRRDPRDQEVRPVVEREVPLGQHADHALAASVHAWLDGELPEAAVRKGEMSRDVEFWRGVNDQMERRRHLRTPDHVESQIMAALPNHVPQLITPWFRREFVITPMAALGLAAALVTLSVAATVAFFAP